MSGLSVGFGLGPNCTKAGLGREEAHETHLVAVCNLGYLPVDFSLKLMETKGEFNSLCFENLKHVRVELKGVQNVVLHDELVWQSEPNVLIV